MGRDSERPRDTWSRGTPTRRTAVAARPGRGRKEETPGFRPGQTPAEGVKGVMRCPPPPVKKGSSAARWRAAWPRTDAPRSAAPLRVRTPQASPPGRRAPSERSLGRQRRRRDAGAPRCQRRPGCSACRRSAAARARRASSTGSSLMPLSFVRGWGVAGHLGRPVGDGRPATVVAREAVACWSHRPLQVKEAAPRCESRPAHRPGGRPCHG